LPEKYDGNVNPAEFLQIYSTSILAMGGNEVVMANYFPVALTGIGQSWLLNLPEGSLTSWGELCC
jgi:K+-transporting ATPase c subunit